MLSINLIFIFVFNRIIVINRALPLTTPENIKTPHLETQLVSLAAQIANTGIEQQPNMLISQSTQAE